MKKLQELVNKLSQTNSSNEKKEILAQYPECKSLLEYTFNPLKQFYVTSNNLQKRKDLIKENVDLTIFELLDKLSNREITGHEAISVVNGFIEENKEFEDLIYKIVDKNLKVRIDAKLINKVWSDLIPEFEVALAKKYEDYKHRINFEQDAWFASRKMDGVRVITIIDENGGVSFWSRNGKEFFTLNALKEKITEYSLKSVVLDGEVCIIDAKGNENFSSVMREIRRKDHTIKNPKYKLFDMLTLEGFTQKKQNDILSRRLGKLNATFQDNIYLDPIEQIKVKDNKQLAKMTAEAVASGWEGLILRKDVSYEGKRTDKLLKVKQFFDAEYTILDVEFGKIRFIEDDKEKEEEMLSSVVIQHKGYDVHVGSGFSIDQRRYYYEHPDELIGSIITVVYFEETENKQGTISLRFPTIKAIYGKNGREA